MRKNTQLKLESVLRKILKEENELLKAQSQCKAALFQVKKALDPIIQNAIQIGLLKSGSSRIRPYNDGFELIIDKDENWDVYTKEMDSRVKNMARILGQRIYIQPGTFFEDHLGSGSRIEGRVFDAQEAYKSFREDISNKAQIAPACKKFVEINLKALNQIK